MEKNYNIHNFVKFKIQYDEKWVFNNILEHYGGYISEKVEDPDFIVKLGTYRPSEKVLLDKQFFCTDERYIMGPNYFECLSDTYKIAKWSFRLTNLSGTIIAEIGANAAGYLYMAGLVIDLLIEVFSCMKHAPMLHASYTAQNNNGLLIAARGGGGKTSLALHLVEEYGFKLLSDNFTIIHQGEGWGYQTPLNVFGYNINSEIKSSFTTNKKLEFFAKRMLYLLSGGYFKLFTRVNPQVLYHGKMVDSCQIKAMILLIPYTGKEVKIEEALLPDILSQLVINQKLDFQYYHDYALEHQFFFDAPIFRHWERYSLELLNNLGEGLKVYKVLVPVGKPQPYAEEILGRLKL